MEIFCQIPIQNLQFLKTADGYRASYEIAIALFDRNDVQSAGLTFVDSVNVQHYEDIFRLDWPPHLVRFTFLLEPGEYQANVHVLDMATRAYFRFEKHLTIPDYFGDGLKISDLQLAVAISRTDQESELVKNNLKIIPNVPHIFGTDSRILYVYSELYNLDFPDQLCNSRFNAIFTIVDKNGRAIKSYNIAHEKPASSCALSYAISLEDLQAGPYRLTLQVEDSTNSRMAFQSTNLPSLLSPMANILKRSFPRCCVSSATLFL